VSRPRKILAAALLCFLISLSSAQAPSKFLDGVKDYAVKHNPDWAESEVLITVKSGQSFFDKYAGDPKVKFKIAENFTLTKVTSNLILPVVAFEGDEELARSYVGFRIEVLQNVVVAREKILKGQIISEEQLAMGKKEVALYPNKYFLKTDKVKDKAAAALIPAGTILLEWMVKDKPDISRGQTVRILARAEGVEVWSSGVAVTEGRVGESIKVKRPDSKNKIEGKILSNEIVEVQLP
jgi:flagella basal body P-ring formation protein FlgA